MMACGRLKVTYFVHCRAELETGQEAISSFADDWQRCPPLFRPICPTRFQTDPVMACEPADMDPRRSFVQYGGVEQQHLRYPTF